MHANVRNLLLLIETVYLLEKLLIGVFYIIMYLLYAYYKTFVLLALSTVHLSTAIFHSYSALAFCFLALNSRCGKLLGYLLNCFAIV